MLSSRRPVVALAAATGLAVAACTGSGEAAPAPESSSTTTTTTTEPVERPTTIRVGLAVNASAPTAALDSRIETILSEAAVTVGNDVGIAIELRPVSVDSPGEAEGTVALFINDGVSVVITGCDDATVPAVIEAATASELLAVTGCVALPRPDLDELRSEIDTELFVDTSSLGDNAEAIANFAATEGFSSLGVVESTLFPDVERTCVDLQDDLTSNANPAASPVAIAEPLLFAELVDDPAEVVSNFSAAFGDESPDAVVICALAPTVGDVVAQMREAGIDTPVILPWFADGQVWSEDTNDVFVLTASSRYGDDPEPRVSALIDALTTAGEETTAVDVVTADTLAVLGDAAARSGSVGSRRLAETLREQSTTNGISGLLTTGGNERTAVERTYRVIEVQNGTPTFVELLN